MTQPCILAVDPGLSGALAFYFPTVDAITTEDMPVVGGDVDVATLSARIAQMKPDLAIVELVASRPGQGVASVFKFGCGFGMVRGVISANGIPMHLVAPAKWNAILLWTPTKRSPARWRFGFGRPGPTCSGSRNITVAAKPRCSRDMRPSESSTAGAPHDRGRPHLRAPCPARPNRECPRRGSPIAPRQSKSRPARRSNSGRSWASARTSRPNSCAGEGDKVSPSSRIGAKMSIRRVLNQYFRPKGLHYRE